MTNPDVPPPPSDSGGPPPPPPGFGEASPPAYQQPSPSAVPPPYGQPPPPYTGPIGGTAASPPRPDVKLGAILTLVGSIATIIAVFLPWVSGGGDTLNGFDTYVSADDFTLYEGPGTAVIFFAVITAGFGIALYFAGRVLAVAILAIIGAAISLFVGIFVVSIASDTADIADSSLGFGAILVPIAPLLTLAGAIIATSKRRKWPAA